MVCVIDVATGATTAVPGSFAFTDMRSVGWIDDATLWYAGGNLAVYSLSAANVVTLPGTDGAYDAVLRGTTFFYLAATFSTSTASATASLRRYSLTTHSSLGVPISLGAFDLPTSLSQAGYIGLPGWDASPDGTHVAYQMMTAAAVSSGNHTGIASTLAYVASVDGSSPRPILQSMPMTSPLNLRFSPDGSQVAATEQIPGSDIASGCVASSGASGDPCVHTYTVPEELSDLAYPVWAPDGHSFLVGASSPGGGLWRYGLGATSGVLVWRDGYSPWAV
jgi:hypothetical protein